MTYKIYTPLRHKGIDYTIVYLPTNKDFDNHLFHQSYRLGLENKYGKNLVFVTDETYSTVSKPNNNVKFDADNLLSLPFQTVTC